MRRRMLIENREIEGIVYKLSSPVIFDGSNNIDTGLHLYQDYDDFTFFADIEFDANEQVGTVGSQPTIIACMHELNPWPGFALRYNPGVSSLSLIFGSSPETYEQTQSGLYRYKVCVSVKNKRCESAYFKIGDAEPTKKNVQDNTSQNNIEQAVLVLGSYRTPQGVYGRYWKGTIYKFVVYNRALSEEDINKLF